MRTANLAHLLRPCSYHAPFSGHTTHFLRKLPVQRLWHTFSEPPPSRLKGRQLFVGVVGLGLAGLSLPRIYCDTTPKGPSSNVNVQPVPNDNALPPPPTSSVSFYELGFGTVAGVCAGVFIKKGAKAAAWLLGGIFVLLQYLNSASLIRVDWTRISSRFEDLFYTTEDDGSRRPPTVRSLWNWIVNFLTADFQPRASFVAGFALGLRIG